MQVKGTDACGGGSNVNQEWVKSVSNNKASSNKDYIYGQKNSKYSDMPFGLSTVGKTGCGAVACYNALISTGRDVRFRDVVTSFNIMFMLGMGYTARGRLGVTSFQVEIFWRLILLNISIYRASMSLTLLILQEYLL